MKNLLKIFLVVLVKIFIRLKVKINNLKKRILPIYLNVRWNNRISFGQDFKFGKYSQIYFHQFGHGNISISNHVVFRNYCSIAIEAGHLKLANNVFFNSYCSSNYLGEIVIGEHTIFGEGVRLYDHNHNFKTIGMPVYEQGMKIGKIEIGKNCWIGANTIILNNVTIGDNVVIGANNLIYKNIASNTLVKSVEEKIITSKN